MIYLAATIIVLAVGIPLAVWILAVLAAFWQVVAFFGFLLVVLIAVADPHDALSIVALFGGLVALASLALWGLNCLFYGEQRAEERRRQDELEAWYAGLTDQQRLWHANPPSDFFSKDPQDQRVSAWLGTLSWEKQRYRPSVAAIMRQQRPPPAPRPDRERARWQKRLRELGYGEDERP